ncbi:Protein CBG04872 [Caenorhabditis briggsae]|uniref:Protein CBG04872 n=1 Tax=Caenorhabditis briggsae TaxID=6238 RepID=A8WYP2_CAEBR|nr:Protein CBG04872 [Caenorhabditis briggsae]CAP25500.1 Protein CBG04872 [Caenorhabditis briggsae]
MPKKQRYSLADMPEKVIMLILENSDFRSILNLRKVSYDLRNFIDEKKPDLQLEIIQIHIDSSRVKILTASEIPEEFKKVLKANPLKTECFAITTSGPNEILDVISSIDSGNLKEICFYNIDELPEEVWDFEEIVKLEQWKNSAILEMVQFYVHLEIWNFLHFSQAHFRILEITVDDIFELKKNYLLMPSFKFVHVEYKNLIGEIYEMGATELGNHQKWLFKFPENSEFVLEVSLSPKNLYFRKIPVSHVPDSALI